MREMGMSQPKQELVMLKKLILATVGLAIAAPALADNRHRGYRHDYRPHVVHRPAVVHHYRPVVHQYYRPAPRPVYVVHRAPPPPPVVYHQVGHHHPHPGPALLFGAIVGAAVVHGIMAGH
jgi:hypothetical protein